MLQRGRFICRNRLRLPVVRQRVARRSKRRLRGGHKNGGDTVIARGYASVSGLALDADGDVVLAGGGNNGATPTPSALESCPGYGYTGFVAKLSGSSGAVEFLTNFGCEQSYRS